MKERFIKYLKTNDEYDKFYSLLENKNFEEIYNLYGKEVYLNFTPSSYQKKDIDELLKNHEFEKIRVKYGKVESVKAKFFSAINNYKIDKKAKCAVALGLTSLSLFTACKKEDLAHDDEIVTTSVSDVQLDNKHQTEKSSLETIVDSKITEATTTKSKPKVAETETSVETTMTEAETSVETTVSETETPAVTDTETSVESTVFETEAPVETTVTEIEEEIPVVTETETIEEAIPRIEIVPGVDYHIDKDDNLSEDEIFNYNLYVDAYDYLSDLDVNSITSVPDLNKSDKRYSKTCILADIDFLGSVAYYNQDVVNKNLELYKDYVDEYNVHLEEYANYIKSLNLDDMHLFAKVMDDTWSSLEDGFGQGKYDVYGLLRVDIDQKDSSGLCRNICDDFTTKLKAINPDLEPVQVLVSYNYNEINYTDLSYPFKNRSFNEEHASAYIDVPFAMDTEIKDSKGNELSYLVEHVDGLGYDSSNAYGISINSDRDKSEFIGDHIVCMVSIKDDVTKELKYHLIIDPTNGFMSVLKDGKIMVLSKTDNTKGLELKTVGTIIFESFEDSTAVAKAVIDSRVNTDLIDLEDAKKNYGNLSDCLEDIREQYGDDVYSQGRNR